MPETLDHQIMQVVTSSLSTSSDTIERRLQAPRETIREALGKLYRAGLLTEFKDPVRDETYWAATETGFQWVRQESSSGHSFKIPA